LWSVRFQPATQTIIVVVCGSSTSSFVETEKFFIRLVWLFASRCCCFLLSSAVLSRIIGTHPPRCLPCPELSYLSESNLPSLLLSSHRHHRAWSRMHHDELFFPLFLWQTMSASSEDYQPLSSTTARSLTGSSSSSSSAYFSFPGQDGIVAGLERSEAVHRA
jgi:hypothetical protein